MIKYWILDIKLKNIKIYSPKAPDRPLDWNPSLAVKHNNNIQYSIANILNS